MTIASTPAALTFCATGFTAATSRPTSMSRAALGREGECHRSAHALGRTSDDRNAAFELKSMPPPVSPNRAPTAPERGAAPPA